MSSFRFPAVVRPSSRENAGAEEKKNGHREEIDPVTEGVAEELHDIGQQFEKDSIQMFGEKAAAPRVSNGSEPTPGLMSTAKARMGWGENFRDHDRWDRGARGEEYLSTIFLLLKLQPPSPIYLYFVPPYEEIFCLAVGRWRCQGAEKWITCRKNVVVSCLQL